MGNDTNESQFNPVIVDRDGAYCVYLADLNVSGEGSTLEEAYRNYKANLAANRNTTQSFGLATAAPVVTPKRKPVLWQELAMFFTKTAVAAAAVIIVVVLLLPNIGAAMRNQVNALIPANLKDPAYWLVQFPAKVNNRMDQMTPADTEQMNKEWARLLDRYGPALRSLKCQL